MTNEEIKSKLLEGIQALIRKHGISQKEFATVTGLSQGRTSQVFTGNVYCVSIRALIEAALALGLEVSISFHEKGAAK